MRSIHLGQHHEVYNAADIYDLCFALALASTGIGEFDVSAFCTDVGVPLRHTAEVLCGSVLLLANDCSQPLALGQEGVLGQEHALVQEAALGARACPGAGGPTRKVYTTRLYPHVY